MSFNIVGPNWSQATYTKALCATSRRGDQAAVLRRG
jgi:hypothetical protein